MTIRPPGRVTRTISLATSNGFGVNMAPKMLTTRSNVLSGNPGEIGRIAFLKPEVRKALLLRTPVPGLHEVARDIHTQNVRAKFRRRHSRRAIAASEIQDLKPS